MRETIARVAPLQISVLFTGQSRTDNEVATRSLHSLSNRVDKLFVSVTCGAIPPDMIEGGLLGYLKGALTGAGRAHEGLFLCVRHDTLFFNEIDELAYMLQIERLVSVN